jgi:hypothetical protein
MYDTLMKECDTFGWDKMTKPLLTTELENDFLPEGAELGMLEPQFCDLAENSRSPSPFPAEDEESSEE